MTAAQETLDGLPEPRPTPVPAAGPEPTVPMPATTRAVLAALIDHYRKPGSDRSGEILITEAAAPGGGTTRRADLIRIGMWASRGTGIDVHEIKVSRPDWLRELDDPAKAEAWWPYCNRFWITAPPGIVRDGELPAGWGLMEPQARSRRFKVIVQAASKPPKLTVGLFIELMRRADNDRLREMDGMEARHKDALRAQERKIRAEISTRGLPQAVQDRLEILQKVEAAIGLELSDFAWAGEKPLRQMSGPELGAVLADSRDHIAAQRLIALADKYRDRLTKAAASVIEQLEREK